MAAKARKPAKLSEADAWGILGVLETEAKLIRQEGGVKISYAKRLRANLESLPNSAGRLDDPARDTLRKLQAENRRTRTVADYIYNLR